MEFRGDIQDRAMRERSLESAYEETTPRPAHRNPVPVHPAAHRQRRASFDTASTFTAASSATSVSVLAAQQNELVATVARLARSVESLTQNSVNPAQIHEITDKLNMMTVNSPVTNTNNRVSPYSRNQPYVPPGLQSRLDGNGRFGSFPAPPAFQHQQRPRQTHMPPPPPIPPFFPSRQASMPPVRQAPTYHTPPQNTMRQYPVPITPWGEPEPVRNLFFTGKSNELKRFLVEIRDAIRPHHGRFLTDSRRINWVAQHFLTKDSKANNYETASQNWFDSLLATNAQQQGRWSQFADLKSFDYIIPELFSLEHFYEALIKNFEDKDAVRTANDALESFTQERERLSISDFNAKWRVMASQTSLSVDSVIKLYKQNIHPAIAAPASNIERWVTCTSLDEKMNLALNAAGMATRLAKLPANHPFSTKGTKYASFPGISLPIASNPSLSHIRVQADPDRMQVDAVSAPRPPPSAWASMPEVWARIKSICWTRRFCFRCLQALDSSHGDPGRFRCPNTVASVDQGLSFLSEHKPSKSTPTEVQVDAMEVEGWTGNMYDDQEKRLREMTSEYLAHQQNERRIGDLEVCAISVPPISKDRSRFFVFISLMNGEDPILIKAFVDTGAMGCFINSKIVKSRKLKHFPLPHHVSCSGFDGSPGKNIVKSKWLGKGSFCIGEEVSNPYPFDLMINDIGSYDAILGMPWLEENEAKIFCRTGNTSMELASLALSEVPIDQSDIEIVPIIDASRSCRKSQSFR